MTTNFKQVAIDSLVPYAKNSRNHPPGQIDQIAASIKEFGFLSPCVISADNTIIAGHGRVMAAKKLGIETVPCVVADHLTDAQRRAYVLIDNRLTDTSEWDKEMLKIELADLTVNFPELDLPVMGFSPEEIEALGLNTIDAEVVGLTDEDAVPEAPKTPTTKTGDIWLLGNNRVMCGDSTDAGAVALLMGAGDKPMLMMTDPPYGVKLDQSWRDKALGDKALGKGNKNVVSNDDIADWSNAWCHFPGDVAYIWHAGKFSDVVMNSIRSVGFDVCQQLIWNKSVMVMGRSDYHFKHEPCWYAVRKGKTHRWVGDRKQTTVIDAKSPNHIMSGSDEEKTEHPTQKPVDCMMLIKNHDGDVYDPFLGSGSTLIACEKTGRRCFGMELSPQYVDVIVKRWQDFTGRLATLEGDGRTFEEVQLERVG